MPGCTKITRHVTLCSITAGDVNRRLGWRNFRHAMINKNICFKQTNHGQNDLLGGGFLIRKKRWQSVIAVIVLHKLSLMQMGVLVPGSAHPSDIKQNYKKYFHSRYIYFPNKLAFGIYFTDNCLKHV